MERIVTAGKGILLQSQSDTLPPTNTDGILSATDNSSE